MNVCDYRVVFFRGYDRDDWDALTFKAGSIEHARKRAWDLVPDGWTIKSVKRTENQ